VYAPDLSSDEGFRYVSHRYCSRSCLSKALRREAEYLEQQSCGPWYLDQSEEGAPWWWTLESRLRAA
jgi:hypothetical protein